MSLSTELSNLSYTNKDFNSIYTELLEYAKKLSYKWDPSASDESDPGVVLLKLAAIIGDKDSYNIDKNILELMPASVTQLPAARQLFDQCGYSMHYYNAAEGLINILIKKDFGDNLSDTDYLYKVPRFTMFSDSDKSVIYTSTEDRTLSLKTEQSIPVIEGTIVKYTVNNDPLITLQNLDSKNRIYFSETNIAENGIFITNVKSSEATFSNYDSWERVDNLQTQPKGKSCYKFGLTIDGGVCYIEFPDDIDFLFGEGLNISYVLTNGSTGNVAAGRLNQFYIDTHFTRTDLLGNMEEDVVATTEFVSIRNSLPILNGQDPESIEDAYKNYKRVRDTFNTLVSLKDYSDYLVSSEAASNGYVCDRTNDIQHAYKVLSNIENSTYVKTIVDSKTRYECDDKTGKNARAVSVPVMEPFDLCIYALKYVANPDSETSYKTSFELFDLSKTYQIDYVFSSDVKSLQHNYKEFEKNKILMLKNKYSIQLNVIPRQTLSTTEKMQVMYNIELALCKALNSKKVSFGEPISLDIIQEAVLTADERVKNLIDFTAPTYQTYAVYKNSAGDIAELRIDNDSHDGGYVPTRITKSEFHSGSISEEDIYVKDPTNNKFTSVKDLDNKRYDSTQTYYKYDSAVATLWDNFRTEIFGKNVLAGVTPLYTDDNQYTATVRQTNVREYNPIKSISTNSTLTFVQSENDSNTYTSRYLHENENLLLTCPNLISENNYSSYVKFIYYLPNITRTTPIPEGTDIELKESKSGTDYIIFFSKDSNSSSDYTYVKYDASDKSLAKYFSTKGFDLALTQDLTSFSTTKNKNVVNSEAVLQLCSTLPSGKGSTKGIASSSNLVENDAIHGNITSLTTFVKEYLVSEDKNQVLTGTKIIETKNVNRIRINNNKTGTRYISWVLNRPGSTTYTLFDTDQHEYVLKSGEYFLYTDDDKTVLYILGEGTKILRSSSDSASWRVNAVSYEDILIRGIDIIDWYTVELVSASAEAGYVDAIEQQMILIGPDNKIVLNKSSQNSSSSDKLEISSEGFSLMNYDISYVDSDGNVTYVPTKDSTIESDCWHAFTLLNITLSSEQSQILYEKQEIIVEPFGKTGTEGNSIICGTSTVDGSAYTPVYVQSTHELVLNGMTVVDADSIYGETTSVGIKSYQLTDIEGMSNIHDGFDVVVLNVPKAESDPITASTFVLNFQLLPGNYLLKMATSDTVEELVLKMDDTSGATLEHVTGTNTWKLNITDNTKDDALTVKLTIEVTRSQINLTGELTLTISKLFKYKTTLLESITRPKGKTDSFEAKLLELLSNLDVEGKFDYTHIPKNPIENPLNSSEFLKASHFYNPYTICQWNVDTANTIAVHDVVR